MSNNPLVLSPDEFNHVQNCGHDWSNTELTYLRNRFETALFDMFHHRCFYCGFSVDRASENYAIEHIIPKGKYKAFSFHNNNLALSCRGCNSAKHTQETLIRSLRNRPYMFQQYPSNPTDFIIVHAHYDNYEKSIRVRDTIFCEGIDEKGWETIRICKLNRLALAEKRITASREGSIGLIKQLVQKRDSISDHLNAVKDLLSGRTKLSHNAIITLSGKKNARRVAEVIVKDNTLSGGLFTSDNVKLIIKLLDLIDPVMKHQELIAHLQSPTVANVRATLQANRDLYELEPNNYVITSFGYDKILSVKDFAGLHRITLDALNKKLAAVKREDLDSILEILIDREQIVKVAESFLYTLKETSHLIRGITLEEVETIENNLGDVSQRDLSLLSDQLSPLKNLRSYYQDIFSNDKIEYDSIKSAKRKLKSLCNQIDKSK